MNARIIFDDKLKLVCIERDGHPSVFDYNQPELVIATMAANVLAREGNKSIEVHGGPWSHKSMSLLVKQKSDGYFDVAKKPSRKKNRSHG